MTESISINNLKVNVDFPHEKLLVLCQVCRSLKNNKTVHCKLITQSHQHS